MLSKRIPYKYHIYAQCRLRSTRKTYCIFEIYLVKYTNLVQSYSWQHFQFIVLLNFKFTMLSTHISNNTIFMHNLDFKSDL